MIDPTIALQGPKQFGPDWQTVNQIREVNQDLQTKQAQLPGVQAQAAMLQRQNEGQQWLQDNAHNFTNPDGTFDARSASVGVANAGFPDVGNSLLAHYLDNDVLSTATAKGRLDLVNGLMQGQSAILGTMTPGLQRNAFASQQQSALNSAGFVPNTGLKMGDAANSRFWAIDPSTGQPIIDPNGNHALDETKIQAARMATVPVDLQETIRSNQLQNHTSPQALDPNSQLSQSTNALAIKLGFANAGDPPQSDWYWQQRPDFQTALKNNVPSQSFQESQKSQVMAHTAAATTFQNAINASTAANLPALFRPGVAIQNILNNLSNDPNVAAFKSMLAKAKLFDPTIDESVQDGPAVLAKLQADLGYHSSMKNMYGGATVTGPSPTEVTGIPSAGNPSSNIGVGANQQGNPVPAQSGPATPLPPQNTFVPVNKPAVGGNIPQSSTQSPNQTSSSNVNSKGYITLNKVQDIVNRAGGKLTKQQVIDRYKQNGYTVEGN